MKPGRKIAISDIHGCRRTFRHLLDQQLKVSSADELYLLGDFIDRGPDSRGVIDDILNYTRSGYKVTCLKGNHEDLMLNHIAGVDKSDVWIQNGAFETLESFGITSASELDRQYLEFFNELSYYAEVDNYILVHAGLNFRRSDPLEDKHAMLWIRNFVADEAWLKGRVIVHGHTPQTRSKILSRFRYVRKTTLNIDGGCVYHTRPGMGHLFAFDMTHNQLYFQENLDAG